MLRSRHYVAAIFLSALVALLFCGRAHCVTTLRFDAQPLPKGGALVTVNGAKVLSIRRAPQGAVALARQISEALGVAAELAPGPDDVKVVGEEPLFSITVAGSPVAAVGRVLAYANRSTPAGLASKWAAAIRQVFSSAYLCIPATECTIPFGESRIVPVKGNLEHGLQIEGPSGIVSWRIVPEGVLLTANSTGRGLLTINSAHASISINVWAAKYAGALARAATAIVTGVSVPRSILVKAALLSARQAAVTEPGGRIDISAPVVASPLPAGQTGSAAVPVTISGREYLTRSGTVSVAIANQALAKWEADAGVLLVSNKPERLRATGLWFQAALQPDKPARFLYHHVNGLTSDAALIVEVENAAASPARVHIMEGVGGPSQHEIYTGHMAVKNFLSRQSGSVGYVANLPSASRYAAVAQYLRPGDVVSGVVEIRLLDPVPMRLNLRLVSRDEAFLLAGPSERQSALGDASSFPNPRKKLEGTYTLGGKWLFLSMGRDPVQNHEGNASLLGNYGVTYEMRIEIANPSGNAGLSEIVMTASGGVAQGVFILDGALMETPLLRAYEEAIIARILVPAGQTRVVNIRTMPQPGSNYPVRVVVRPAAYSRRG